MIETRWKPKDEIKYSLKNAKKISILSCGACANLCGTGGTIGINFLKDLLKEWGKEVVFSRNILIGCSEETMRQTLRINRRSILRSDALVIIACSGGVKTAFLCEPMVPVVGVLDTVGAGAITRLDNLVARSMCIACGHCVLNYTGGICPLSECPLKMKYGPCEEAPKNGMQCAVNPYQNCVWREIAKRAGDLLGLEELRQIHKAEEGKSPPPGGGRPSSLLWGKLLGWMMAHSRRLAMFFRMIN